LAILAERAKKGSPMNLQSASDFISTLSSQGAAWYRGLTGTPVVVPATSAAIAAQQQVALNQAAQAQLNVSSPLLSGVLANPAALVIIGLVLLIAAIWLLRK
jgi:hypothetical protein